MARGSRQDPNDRCGSACLGSANRAAVGNKASLLLAPRDRNWKSYDTERRAFRTIRRNGSGSCFATRKRPADLLVACEPYRADALLKRLLRRAILRPASSGTLPRARHVSLWKALRVVPWDVWVQRELTFRNGAFRDYQPQTADLQRDLLQYLHLHYTSRPSRRALDDSINS